MCSSCLTPVYPVEKMVVNKMVLHLKCFCCKHCRKKLSIHNYSSLQGELYCVTHYQQLLKRKGNNDKGFEQSKDHRLPKNKGEDEPDSKFTPKMTKNHMNIIKSERSKETTLEKLALKSPTRETGQKGAADARGKLKLSWPPEKKKADASQTHTTTPNTKRSEADRTAISVRSRPEEVGVDKVDSKRQTDLKTYQVNKAEQSRTESFNTAEMFPSKKTITKTNSAKKVNPLTSKVGQISLNYYDTDNYVKSQRTQLKTETAISKRESNPATKQMDNPQSKVRKYVRFSSQIDVAQYDQSSELNATTEEVIKSRERIADDHSTSEVSTGETGSSIKTAGNRYQQDTTTRVPKQDKGDNSVQNQECPKTFKPSNENRESVSKSSDSQSTLNVIPNESIHVNESNNPRIISKTADCEVVQESNNPTIISNTADCEVVQESKNPTTISNTADCDVVQESNNPAIISNTADCEVVQEARIQINESRLDNPQTDTSVDITPAEKPNSPKDPPKPNDKTKAKLGSWSKGRSTFSKLFTSSGNDKTNKTELKDSKKSDIKPGGGILGRLFQSSTEKNDDVQRVTAQHESNDQTQDEDLRTVKEVKVANAMQDQVYEEQTKAQQLKKESFDENTLNDRKGATETHTSKDESNEQTQDDDHRKVKESEVGKEEVNEEETKVQNLKKDSCDENTLSDGCGVTEMHTSQDENNEQMQDEDPRKVKEIQEEVYEEQTKAQKLKKESFDENMLNDRSGAAETHTSQDENNDQTQDDDLRKIKEGEVAKEMRKDNVYEEETKAKNLKKDAFDENMLNDTSREKETHTSQDGNNDQTQDEYLRNIKEIQDKVSEEETQNLQINFFDENTLSDRRGATETNTSQDENDDQTQDEDLRKGKGGKVAKEIQNKVYEEETKLQHLKKNSDENTLSDGCGATETHTSSETDLLSEQKTKTNVDILNTDTDDSFFCEAASDLKAFPNGSHIVHQNFPGQVGNMKTLSRDSPFEETSGITQHLSNEDDPPLVVSDDPFEQNEVLDEATTQSSFTHFDHNHQSTEDSSICLVLSDTSSKTLEPSQIDAASLAAAPTQSLSLIDSEPITSDMTFNISDQQQSLHNSAPLTESHTESKQVIDLDIFSMNDDVFSPPPFDSVTDHGGSAFPDDIFAVGDISSDAGGFLLLPNSSASSNPLNDPSGSDAFPATASSAPMDIFTDDIFSTETKWVPDDTNNAFMDNFLMSSTSNKSEHKSADSNTGSSWMDDLLG